MMSFYLSGGVEVLGFISPTEPTDEYPVIDPLYGIDGFRNVNTLSDLNSIPNLRRRAGMVVGVSGGTQYYKLNPGPWNGTITDWTIFNSGGGSFTGGTVTGDTIFTQGVTATTFSASTYLGLPLDVYVTGGTYSNGVLSFTNNSGNTFNISGLYTGGTDFYVTGGTFDKNTETLTLERNDGNNVQITGFTDIYTTGFTFNPSNYDISVELNDGTTLTQNLGVLATDVTITGGTYDPLNGSVTFVNNTGGTFTVTGFITGFTDIQVTGYTYQDNTFTISDSSGNTFSATIDTVTGLTVNGDFSVSGQTNLTGKTVVYGNSPTSSAIEPGLDNLYDLGNPSKRWRDIFTTNLEVLNAASIEYLYVDAFSNFYDTSNFYGGGVNITGDTNQVGNLTVTGNTSLQALTATTISAATYQNLPTDIRVTGASYSNNTFTFTNNTGGTFTTSLNTVTGLTINGNLTVTGNTNVRAVTGTTALFSGSGQNILTVVGSGNTTSSPLFTVQGSSGELFSVTDSLVGSLYSVNDISGLPILEVFSDNTILMGSYQAPSLNTTTKVTATTGTTNVYSIPTSAYTGAFFDYTVSDGTNLRAGNIMSIWSGSSVNYTETQTTDFGNTSGLTFNMVVTSGNAILRTSGVTGNWTVKTIVRSI